MAVAAARRCVALRPPDSRGNELILLRRLTATPRRRVVLGFALCTSIALACAIWSVCTIGLLPPKIAPRSLQFAGAEAHIMVDRAEPVVDVHKTGSQDFDSLTRRASLFASLLASESVRADAARRMHVDPAQVGGFAPITLDVPIALTEPDSERRASDIQLSTYPYRIDAESRQSSPIVDIYTRGPTVADAERLADESVAALRRYVDRLTASNALPAEEHLEVEQLGPARGAWLTGGARPVIAVMTFFVAFAVAAGLLLVAVRARRGWSAGGRAAGGPSTPAPMPSPRQPALAGSAATVFAGGGWPRLAPGVSSAVALSPGGLLRFAPSPRHAGPTRAAAARARLRAAARRGGDWPRTTRVLPWMVAGFIAMLWLVPFNSIELSFSTPIDMHLDRLVLPFIVGTWLLAMAAGGRGAPRIRLTWIHAGVALFVAMAFLSVVIDARYLNQTLELILSLKKLMLLVTYAMVFVVVAQRRPPRRDPRVPDVLPGLRRPVRARGGGRVSLPLQRLLPLVRRHPARRSSRSMSRT